MRWFLDTDNDSHWYLVPVERKAEWNAWLDIDSDDEASWTAPDYVRELGCSPTCVTFVDPKVY